MSVTFEKDESYGVHNGQNVSKYTVSNSTGLTLVVIEYGATIISVQAPDRNGVSEEMTLNYSTLDDVANKARYFGVSVGRYANRINGGKFSIDGESYQLNVNNNGINHLHGGNVGYDKKVWSSRIVRNAEDSGVEFTCVSPDGDENYPGTLEVSFTYLVSHTSNSLTFNFAARTLDKPTIVNLTNHAYWNLSGNLRGKILDHTFQLSCSRYVPVTEALIPTGELKSVIDTPFSFVHPKHFSEGVMAISGGGAQGIDHCYVVDAALDADGAFIYDAAKQRLNKHEYLRHIATLSDPASGRCMTVYGTQPGVQVYTCNFLSQDAKDAPYIQHNAVCLETQHLPDSPNHAHFPTTVLRPTDEPYFHQTVHVFSTMSD